MNLNELVGCHDTQNEIIIKKRKEILEFTIRTSNPFQPELYFYADSEKFCIGNTTIKMKD